MRALRMAVGLVAAISCATYVWAVVPVAVGPQFQVDHATYNDGGYTYANGYSRTPALASAANGDFVVVWERRFYVPDDTTVLLARRYDRAGTAKGGEFRVATADPSAYGEFLRPGVASAQDGSFIVVWSDDDVVWARRYAGSGGSLGPAIRVSDGGSGYRPYTNQQNHNGVALGPDGSFMAVWEGFPVAGYGVDDIRARRFDASGAPLGPEFAVNTPSPDRDERYPGIGADVAGNFVVVWQHGNVQGQRFDAGGAPLGPVFSADLYPSEIGAGLAVAPQGHFLVVEGFGSGAQPFDANGAPVASRFEVGPDVVYSAAAADTAGNFLVAWTNDSSYADLFAQPFDAAGQPLGPSTKLSIGVIETPFGVSNPSVTADPTTGDFVVVWANDRIDYGYAPAGILGRRVAICGNGRLTPGLPCDDGNDAPGDGCNAVCQEETCFYCAGEPSACSALAGCGAVCSTAAAVDDKATLTLKKILVPTGDEVISLRGKILNPPLAPGSYDPSVEGAEVAITGAQTIYARANPTPVPPGLQGSGCGLLDGWKVSGRAPNRTYTYKNLTGALPPACTPGSANGLRVMKLKDQLAKDGTFQFQVTVKNATLPPAPAAPVTATVVLGQSPAAGAAGRCGRMRFGQSFIKGSTARYVP